MVHYIVAQKVNSTLKGGKFYLKGDDLIAYWSSDQIELYFELMPQTGMSANKLKSFRSRKYGIFCEKIYTLAKCDEEIFFKRADICPSLRVITSSLGDGQEWGVPSLPILTVGKTLFNVMAADMPEATKWRLVSFISQPYIGGYSFVRDVHLPLALGGLGLPPRHMSKKLDYNSSVLLNAAHNGHVRPQVWTNAAYKSSTAGVAVAKAIGAFWKDIPFWPSGQSGQLVMSLELYNEANGKISSDIASRAALQGGDFYPRLGVRRGLAQTISAYRKHLRTKGERPYGGKDYRPSYHDAYRIVGSLRPDLGEFLRKRDTMPRVFEDNPRNDFIGREHQTGAKRPTTRSA
jgi:hypothetical protein